MSKLTIKAIAEKSGVSATLIRAVSRQFGGWDALKESAVDIAAHGADGGFSGFIYYSDTVAFTRKNKVAIIDDLIGLSEEIGDNHFSETVAGFRCFKGEFTAQQITEVLYRRFKDAADTTAIFNALAWFALEHVAQAVAAEED